MGSIVGSERVPGVGHGYPVQYSCMENPMDRGAWWAIVIGLQRVGHDLSDGAHTQSFAATREKSTNQLSGLSLPETAIHLVLSKIPGHHIGNQMCGA